MNLAVTPEGSEAASKKTLTWSVVDTPSDNINGMIIRPVGINSFALGPDKRTFYATDTARNGFYKSTDGGYNWSPHITTSLTGQGAFLPVWDVIVAPDDANFVLAVTDGSVVPSGPKNLFLSTDGGGTWSGAGLAIDPLEYISCVDISSPYGPNNQTRDIAVGTRVTAGTGGRLLTRQYSSTLTGGWADQLDPVLNPGFVPASMGITSIKFSPSYSTDTDQTIAVISSTATGMWLHLGKHASTGSTTWNGDYNGYPVPLNAGINASTIINTSLELPTGYVGSNLNLRRCFISMYSGSSSAVFYVNNSAIPVIITPPMTTPGQRISSIAYFGTNATGILLAAESSADPTQARINIWLSGAAQALDAAAAGWLKSDTLKSPTGGGNTGRANPLLDWSADGSRVYCGTSSDNAITGGTGTSTDTDMWPFSKLTGATLDESAFSFSADNGHAWNQIGIINTRISRLSDAAAYEKAENDSSSSALYLATLNTEASVASSFDSVWRSNSDPLGYTWERILTWSSNDDGAILRTNPREDSSQKVIVYADLGSASIIYSDSEGDLWSEAYSGLPVTDISLLDDTTMYILGGTYVRKFKGSGTTWKAGPSIYTDLLEPGHTIATPMAPSKSIIGNAEDIVVVGTGGNTDSNVAWADFAKIDIKFTALKELRQDGDIHVTLDSKFDSNRTIYAGINTPGNDGIIYRWELGKSVDWAELDPLNISFFGLASVNDVLYGVWHQRTTAPPQTAGADRTLYPRIAVPPPPEWDELITGLTSTVEFTREPSSLQVSSNQNNTLWAVDNRPYTFDNQTGCLWSYVDSAITQPWPVAPPPGGFISPDTVSGRARQLDFKWRPMLNFTGYDLLIAKDVDFTLLLSQVLQMTPLDDKTGAWMVTPADQESPSCWISPGVLEVGRSYYWKVRGNQAISGEKIHSYWSPTMFFSVKQGFMVTGQYLGPALLAPAEGPCFNCKPPIRFSWGPVEGAQKYEFVLASDAQLSDVVVKAVTQTTGYEYKDKLKLSKPYFWQVKAVAPIPSDPSPVGTFTLTAENKTTAQKPSSTTAKPGGVAAPADIWIWIIIVIVVVLLMLINAYVFISRRQDG